MTRYAAFLVAILLLGACRSGSPDSNERVDPVTGQVVRSGMVAVPGGNVFYEVSNPDADGIPLLLIHGGPGGTSCGFGLLDNEILDRPVIRYDQLETGRSDRPGLREQWNIAHSVVEIDAIRDALGLDELHLMGWSWGGSVAAEYVLEGRRDVGAVIFSGPLLSTPAWIEDAKALVATMPEDLQAVIREHEAAGTYDDPAYIAATDSFYARFMDPIGYPPIPECQGVSGNNEVYTTMWGPTEFTATGTLLDYDRTDRLEDLDVPVLILAGEFDEARPVTMDRFASLMPDARVEVIPGAGHAAPAERPALVAGLIATFLDGVETTRIP
ncbi:MAG: proline iminopeptidase-family hydrolase [Bacteroidetes bacterium]|nr:proline iminopeptidase-family hydrolase [Bacteroidota bacterium]MDA0874002.1 proline iminopeptidase-family hydrolase [Bacteroidota bacterium]